MQSAVRVSSRTARAPALEKEKPSKKSVLVVEDSITSSTLLKNILETAGYNVNTAVDGVDGFTQLRSREFDVVVSDVEMPRMNGFDLAAKIRADKKLSEMPIILVTALQSREDRERGMDVGANAYIVKNSFDQSNLLEVMEKLT
jgi:two-component system chemotaxis sensor kinase CheA